MKNKKLVFIRLVSQIVFFFVFVYILWSTTYSLTGKLPSELFFKIDPLLMVITAISERVLLPGLIFSFIMLGLTLILGRFFCGWICPLGTAIDFFGWLNKKKALVDPAVNQRVRKIKFYILTIIAVFAVFGIQIAWLFDPIVITGRFVSLNLIPSVTLLIDSFFIAIIRMVNLYQPLLDLYRVLQENILGIKESYFAHAGAIFAFFLLVCGVSLLVSRLWCRTLCPLGALYAFFSRDALLTRKVDECTFCHKCSRHCRMRAINKDMSYEKQECVLCLDCIYECPSRSTRFVFRRAKEIKKGETSSGEGGIVRREFLVLMAAAVGAVFLKSRGKKREDEHIRDAVLLRPPAALKEEEFLARCIRCGNCMKVCPTNALQPVMIESGAMAMWTPRLVPEIGYCEYNCTLCQQVCPTGAISKISLAKKQKIKIGIAKINKKTCLPWGKNKECIVCEEHCPVPDKAIKIKEEIIDGKVMLRPEIDEDLCIGCAICQTKCPVRPRAIRTVPEKSDRM
ncbi:MAG: 4Fe-4S binding protein [Candidatus Omnitrophota bacterium]